ncbi:MAG: hypothetical protein KIS79_15660, partial [Burkholderiales bacterium]|nr:hypothetical protein [Burkholderiales bacterium]MCW5622545.1 hypothetical protein [Burkholderiales bacterium]
LAMGYSPSATVFSAGVIGFNLGDAAVLPLLYAMVPALFDDERRHRANAILIATLTACAFGVYAIGGLLLDAMTHVSFLGLAPWRAVFVVVTLAGVMIVPLLMLLPGAQPGHKIVGRDATGGSASLDRFLLGMSGSAAAVDDASLFALFQSYTPNKSDAAGARSSSDFSFVTAQAACEVAVARPAKYTSSGVRYCSD